MIGTIVTGRGNKREVIERPRNMAFSQALAASLKKYLRIPETYRASVVMRKQRRAKRVSVTH